MDTSEWVNEDEVDSASQDWRQGWGECSRLETEEALAYSTGGTYQEVSNPLHLGWQALGPSVLLQTVLFRSWTAEINMTL